MLAQRDQEAARLARDQITPQEIEKQRIEIAAEAEAEKKRREAKGEADAILAKYEAEAKGVQLVLEAKAEGYRKLIEGRRIYKAGKDGERQYMSSEEIDTARVNAKNDVDSICNSAS